MKKIIVALCLLMLSCGYDAEPLESDQGSHFNEIWICHNPESPQHGLPCEESVKEPMGHHESCYWVYDASGHARKVDRSFCWVLHRDDCSEVELEWQKKNCHLLNGDMAE